MKDFHILPEGEKGVQSLPSKERFRIIMPGFRPVLVPYVLAGLARITSIVFFLSIVLLVTVQPLQAQTIAVGNCRHNLRSYSTISEAVAAAAAVPNTYVLVCPGTYPEQVTITSSLTLRGLKSTTGAYPVIAIPTGGLASGNASQLGAEALPDVPLTVNVSNLVIDGAGSGANCASGGIWGVYYGNASGTLANVEVRNQYAGGCGVGVEATGGNFGHNTVNLKNCNIHDFDNTGVETGSSNATVWWVNINSSFIVSESPSVQAGISYSFTEGAVRQNVILVPSGQSGLSMENFNDTVTITGNAVVSAGIGIQVFDSNATITKNNLSSNGTGILIIPEIGSYTVSRNTIISSSTAAINLNGCGGGGTVLTEYNTIFGAPVSIANIGAEDTVKNNTINNAGAPTVCP